MLSLSETHYTNKGIKETYALSVNIVDAAMLKETDYVGTVSGNKTDKSSAFEYHTGETGTSIFSAPSIVMECKAAACYGNERAVGTAVPKSGVRRKKIFLVSKVCIQDTGYEKTKIFFERTLTN